MINNFSFLKHIKIFTFLFIIFIGNDLLAQNTISIPFSDGFVGDNAATNRSTNSKYLTALGWSNIQFTQNSPQFVFVAQGNDIPGTILITDNSGVEHGIPRFIKWRAPSGNTITTPVFQPTAGAKQNPIQKCRVFYLHTICIQISVLLGINNPYGSDLQSGPLIIIKNLLINYCFLLL
jgi:hypothetical protein